jgi:hypothetical protein
MARGGGFTRRAAKRISRAVQAFERGDRDTSAVTFRQTSGDDEPLRLCKTTAAWSKNTTATLEVWEDGTPPNEAKSTGVTVEGVVNKSYDVASGVFCLIALAANQTWYLVEAAAKDDEQGCKKPQIGGQDLSTLSGYSASKKQALTHDNGCLKWVDIEDCPEAPTGPA